MLDTFNAVTLIVLVWEARRLDLRFELRPVHGKLLMLPIRMGWVIFFQLYWGTADF